MYAPALVSLPLMKVIADIIDHILRNGSSALIVVVNFILDFPRGSSDTVPEFWNDAWYCVLTCSPQ